MDFKESQKKESEEKLEKKTEPKAEKKERVKKRRREKNHLIQRQIFLKQPICIFGVLCVRCEMALIYKEKERNETTKQKRETK